MAKKEKTKEQIRLEELAQEWLAKIEVARKLKQDADTRYGYSSSIEQYKGNYMSAMPSFIKDIPLIPINEVYSFVKTFIPSVYSRDPKIFFNPEDDKWIGACKMIELGIRSYWRVLRLKKVVKKAIFDAIFSEGWIKTGYCATLGQTDEEAPSLNSNEYVKSQEIFSVRIPFQNMFIDPDAQEGTDDARWLAEKIMKPLDAVIGSTIYDLADGSTESTHTISSGPGTPDKKANKDCEIPYISFYEIWDKDTDMVYSISESGEHLWTPKPWPYDMDGFPHTLLRFNENQDENYAPNLISSWVPQLWEKMKIRAMQLDHIKRFGRQMQCEENALDKSEEQKFATGTTGSLIKTKNGKEIKAIPYPAVQSDMYAVENRIDLDKDNVSGQPNAVRSAPQKTQSRTLGEIDRLISAFNSRQGEPQDIVEEFCVVIAEKIAALMKQYLPGEKFVRATQTDLQSLKMAFPDVKFGSTGFKFTKKQIQDAEFECTIKCGSSLPINSQTRIESLIQALKLGPTIGIQPGGKTSVVIGKTLFEEFELKEIEAAYEEELANIQAETTASNVQASQELQATGGKLAALRASAQREGVVLPR